MNTKPDQSSAIAEFRALHESGCFVLPNPWDVGTALYLQHLGFKALATTSAGVAFARGLPDTVSAIPRQLMLDHIRDVAEATPLPVNADFQNGFADEPEGVAPKPVNVLVSAPGPAFTVARLTELGVRRISVGSALARVAWGAFIRAARGIATSGTFEGLADAAPFADLNEIFSTQR